MKNFRMDKKRVCVVGTVWVLSLLLVGLVVASQTSLPLWTLNAPPFSGYDAVVGQFSNGTYFYERGDWQTWAVTDNASKAFEWAQGNLTVGRVVPESILVQGNITLSSSLVISSNFTAVMVSGGLTAATGLNNALIRFADPTSVYYGVSVEGVGGLAQLNGNAAGQSSAAFASGINFTRSAGGLPVSVGFPSVVVRNVNVYNTFSAGVWCNFYGTTDGGEVWFENVNVQYTCGAADTGYGSGLVVWKSVMDSKWIGGMISVGDVNAFGFLGLALSADEIHPSYLNGHHKIYSANSVDFSCVLLDSVGEYDTLALYSVTDSRFHDSTFNYGTEATNTYDGVKMFGGSYPCENNTFVGNVFKYYASNLAFKYGIEEADSTNVKNLYVGNSGVDCGTGVLRVLSAGSVYSGLNVGTVVTE